MIKRLIFSFFFLSCSFQVQAQSEAFRDIFDQLAGRNKYFFYPSTLRALSGGNEQFLEFIKDIKNLKLIVVNPEDEEFQKLKIDQFRNDLTAEGFAELMTIKEGNSLVTVLENKGTTMALLNSKNSVAMVEMVGQVNITAGMKMLREGELPVNQFQDFFKQENKKEKKPQENSKEESTN